MPQSRRSFLQTVSAAATAMAAGPMAAGQSTRSAKRTSRKLDLLILGGTGFLGPAIVESAMARGHRMTIFNRGKTRPDIFPGVERLRGDRDPLKDDGLAALEGRQWDAAVNVLGYRELGWLRGRDLNPRPLGYEPNELPDCSTPRSYAKGIL